MDEKRIQAIKQAINIMLQDLKKKAKFKAGDKVYRIKDSKKKVFTIECIRGWSRKKQCCYYVLKEDQRFFWYEYQLYFIEQ